MLAALLRFLPVRCAVFAVPAVLGACAGHFAPPARGDLDFAATRVGSGAPELALTGVSADGVSGQLGYRHAVTARDTLEAFAFDHKIPGRRNAFAMGGTGYRRHLSAVDSPVQSTLGFGTALGVGGQSTEWSDNVRHYPGALAGYLDMSVAWRVSSVVTLYAGGRFSHTLAFQWVDRDGANAVQDDALPPATDWVQGGGGVRFDAHPFFLTLDGGFASYSNRVKEDQGGVLSAGLGMRFGGAPVAAR